MQIQKDKLNGFVDEIEKVMEPLTLLSEREVTADPEISHINENIKIIDQELMSLEEAVIPNNLKIQRLQKTIKMILDNEIARKLQMGQETLENMTGVADNC